MVLALLRFSEAVKLAMIIVSCSFDYHLHLEIMVVWEYYSFDSDFANFSDLAVQPHSQSYP